MNGKDSYRQYFKELNSKNKKILTKMLQYLDSRALNEIVYNEVRADLASMLLENQKRGGTSDEVFGNDYKAFCDDLVKNSPRKCAFEILLELVIFLLLSFAVILPLLFLGDTIFLTDDNRVEGLTVICNWHTFAIMLFGSSLSGFGSLYIQRNAFGNKIKVYTIYFIGCILIGAILITLLSHLYNGLVCVNVFICTPILVVLCVLAVAVKGKIAQARLKNFKEL